MARLVILLAELPDSIDLLAEKRAHHHMPVMYEVVRGRVMSFDFLGSAGCRGCMGLHHFAEHVTHYAYPVAGACLRCERVIHVLLL